MADKLTTQQIKFNRDKIIQLQKELEGRKLRGERQIVKLESELRIDLERIQSQIKMFEDKIFILEGIMSSGKPV